MTEWVMHASEANEDGSCLVEDCERPANWCNLCPWHCHGTAVHARGPH